MATKNDPYPGARKPADVKSTHSLTEKFSDRNELAELERQKYRHKPDPDRPEPKGRDPAKAISTEAMRKHNKSEAEAKKEQKYDPTDKPGPYKLDPRHKPAATTDQAKTAMKKRHEDEKKAAEHKKRDESLKWMTANEDGTFKPPEEPPKTLDELKKTTPVPNDKDWAAGKLVKVGSEKYTWKKSGGWTKVA